MSDRGKHIHAARVLLAALVLLCAAAPPVRAQQERGPVRSAVAGVLDEIRDFVVGPPRPAPRELHACGSLYGPRAREIARGPERLNSYNDWVRASYDVVRRIGPLPLCFERQRDTLTSNQGRYLLHVNNYYLDRHPQPYLLTGYTDPQEASPALAQQRAEWIRQRSVEPHCRYPVRRGTATLLEHHRKVHYSPATAGCPRPSPR